MKIILKNFQRNQRKLMHDYIHQYNFVTLYVIKLKVYLILLFS